MIRPFRLVASLLALATPLGLGLPSASAQGPAPAKGDEAGEGRPLDGYVATAVLGALALFLVTKSARR
ncbi:MAG: hypothetical protein JO329_20140 [Planctomycetaceae bacterium]|jgi:hypothetical protein|nr:hypothetical protein [Planctomycetaceae bacterium]MBV8607908.1 hypothetical protein [Singulisphaera sp.]